MFEGSSDYFQIGSHFLSLDEVKLIENYLLKFPLEDITIGDAGEVNNCQVGRLMEDQPEQFPKQLNHQFSTPILDLFRKKEAQEFFSPYLKSEGKQTIRRCQFNLLKEGCFVGRHLDTDSNPNYEIACVLQLGSKFKGGEFIVFPNKESNEDDSQVIKPEYASITISKCKVEHAVNKVVEGTRTSLVVFISNYFDKNKRKKI